jgi:hypothetical protein
VATNGTSNASGTGNGISDYRLPRVKPRECKEKEENDLCNGAKVFGVLVDDRNMVPMSFVGRPGFDQEISEILFPDQCPADGAIVRKFICPGKDGERPQKTRATKVAEEILARLGTSGTRGKKYRGRSSPESKEPRGGTGRSLDPSEQPKLNSSQGLAAGIERLVYPITLTLGERKIQKIFDSNSKKTAKVTIKDFIAEAFPDRHSSGKASSGKALSLYLKDGLSEVAGNSATKTIRHWLLPSTMGKGSEVFYDGFWKSVLSVRYEKFKIKTTTTKETMAKEAAKPLRNLFSYPLAHQVKKVFDPLASWILKPFGDPKIIKIIDDIKLSDLVGSTIMGYSRGFTSDLLAANDVLSGKSIVFATLGKVLGKSLIGRNARTTAIAYLGSSAAPTLLMWPINNLLLKNILDEETLEAWLTTYKSWATTALTTLLSSAGALVIGKAFFWDIGKVLQHGQGLAGMALASWGLLGKYIKFSGLVFVPEVLVDTAVYTIDHFKSGRSPSSDYSNYVARLKKEGKITEEKMAPSGNMFRDWRRKIGRFFSFTFRDESPTADLAGKFLSLGVGAVLWPLGGAPLALTSLGSLYTIWELRTDLGQWGQWALEKVPAAARWLWLQRTTAKPSDDTTTRVDELLQKSFWLWM